MKGNDESYQHENSIRKLQMQLRHFVTVSSGMEVTGPGTLQDAKMSNFVRFYCIWQWRNNEKVILDYEMIAVKISHLAPSHKRNRMSSAVKLIVRILTLAIARAATCIRTTKLVIHAWTRSRWTSQSTFLASTGFNFELTWLNRLPGQKKWFPGIFKFTPPTR